MSTNNSREPAHPIEAIFHERWSPRAFTDETISDETLFSLFEAARWAPSSYNSQPWRFVYVKRDTPRWTETLGTLIEFNQSWAKDASALIYILSKKTFVFNGKEQPATCHTFDTGAAWVSMALQAHSMGWSTHGMVGFNKDAARQVLGVPDDYDIEAAIAVGKRGDASKLPPMLQQREMPSPREPIENLAFEGQFPQS